MTAIAVQEKLITGDELLAMGDIGPCELVEGRIVPMSLTGSNHALIEGEIHARLWNFNQQRKAGWLLVGEAGVYTERNPDSVRGMDVAFISKVRHPARPIGFLEIAPELIVEVISPNDRWRDIQEKLEEYFAIGVDVVWVVEPRKRQLFVYHDIDQLTRLTIADTVRGEGVLEGFELPLAELFAETQDESL